jgi:hypothetical protein
MPESRRIVALAALALVVSACHSAATAPVPSFPGGSLSAAQRARYGLGLETAVAAGVNTLTAVGDSADFAAGLTCATHSGTLIESVDSIFDLDSATYTPNACTYLVGDTITYSYGGLLIITDPTPTVFDGNLNTGLAAFEQMITTPSTSQRTNYNGTVAVSEPAFGQLTQVVKASISVETQLNGTITGHVAYTHTWADTFTVASPANDTIIGTTPLPAGSFAITGTTALLDSTLSVSFVLSTPTVLTIDPTCATPEHVTSGVLTGQVTPASSGTGSIVLTWNGCARPAVTIRNGTS